MECFHPFFYQFYGMKPVRFLLGLFTCILLSFGMLCAQKKDKTTTTPAPAPVLVTMAQPDTTYWIKHYHTVYGNAFAFGDLNMAAHALQHLIVLQPWFHSWEDSLAMVFFEQGAYYQCILASKKVLERKPNDPSGNELTAVSYQSLGMPKEALEAYEKLYALTKNWYHLYEISTLQFALGRVSECNNSLDQIIQSTETATLKVSITGNNSVREEVPLKAAAYNIKGVLALNIGNKDLAKSMFGEALKIYPEFQLAKDNLVQVDAVKK